MQTIVAGLSSDTSSVTEEFQSLPPGILLIAFTMIDTGITMNTKGAMHQAAITAIDPMIALICVRTLRPIKNDSQATMGK